MRRAGADVSRRGTFGTRFEHPGTEFLYMLRGKLEYRHGTQRYLLEPGDSLSFRGDIPHGPERLVQLPIRFLSVIVYGGKGT